MIMLTLAGLQSHEAVLSSSKHDMHAALLLGRRARARTSPPRLSRNLDQDIQEIRSIGTQDSISAKPSGQAAVKARLPPGFS